MNRDEPHVTVLRSVQQFTPLLIDAVPRYRHAPGERWFVDERMSGALLQAVTTNPNLVRSLTMGDQVTTLAGSEQGHSVAAGRADGRVLRWNLTEAVPRT